METEKVNKAAIIRTYLRKNPQASHAEVQDHLRGEFGLPGLKLNSSAVSTARRQLGLSKRRSPKRGVRGEAGPGEGTAKPSRRGFPRSTNSQMAPIQLLGELEVLASKAGGVERLGRAVELLSSIKEL